MLFQLVLLVLHDGLVDLQILIYSLRPSKSVLPTLLEGQTISKFDMTEFVQKYNVCETKKVYYENIFYHESMLLI